MSNIWILIFFILCCENRADRRSTRSIVQSTEFLKKKRASSQIKKWNFRQKPD